MQIYSLSYSIPYLVVFIILLYMSFLEGNHRINTRMSFRGCVTIFILFFCFRGFVGYDWMGYYPVFEGVDTLSQFSSESFLVLKTNSATPEPIEPGFVLYTSIVKSLFGSWKIFVILTTLYPIISISYFIKRNSSNYAFSFALFFALYAGLLIDLMRNGMAIASLLFAVEFFKDKKYIPFILMSILGMSFHNSIILLLPLLLLYKRKLSSRTLWLLFIIVNLLFVLKIPIVGTILPIVASYVGGDKLQITITTYLNSDMAARGFTLGYIVRVFVFIVMMIYRERIYSVNNLIFLFNSYFVSVLISIGLTDLNEFATRMEMNLFFPFIILYPYLLKIMNPIRCRLFASFLALFCLLRIAGGQSTIMADYETMFSGSTYERMYAVKRPAADTIMDDNAQ